MDEISSIISLKMEIIVIIRSLFYLLVSFDCSSSISCLMSFYYSVGFSQMFGGSWSSAHLRIPINLLIPFIILASGDAWGEVNSVLQKCGSSLSFLGHWGRTLCLWTTYSQAQI